MNKRQKILKFIDVIRDSHSEMINIYTKGSCFNFYLILKEMFPEAKAYYTVDHVITKIDDKYYDITGEVKDNKNYQLLEGYSQKQRRDISQMLRAEYPLTYKYKSHE